MSEHLETRLRAALDDYTREIEPSPDGWERIERRIATRTTRPSRPVALLAGAVAAVLVIALSIAVVVNLRDDNTTRVAPNYIGPRQIVAHVDGDLAVIDARTGNVVRVLVPFSGDTEFAQDPQVSPDGKTVYFAWPGGQCPEGGLVIDSVGTAGGDPQLFAAGESASISPDGASVAIAGPPSDDPCGGTRAFTVWDRATGRLVLDYPARLTSIDLVGWSSDSERIIYRTGSPGTAYELDPSDPATAARKLQLPIGAQTVVLGRTGLVAVADNDDRLQGFRIVAADPERGTTLRTLVSDPTRHVISLDADPTGRHLVYWTGSNTGPYELWRSSDRGKPVLVRRQQPGTGVEPEAVWVP